MSTIGKTIVVTGELRADEDMTIEGRVDGPILCETCSIVIAADGQVHGMIIARDITVHGRTTGQLIATEVVDVRATAAVSGQAISPRFILDPDALFEGHVEPQHLEAALRVARYRQRQRDTA